MACYELQNYFRSIITIVYMVLHGFTWFYMVLHGFTCLFLHLFSKSLLNNRPNILRRDSYAFS